MSDMLLINNEVELKRIAVQRFFWAACPSEDDYCYEKIMASDTLDKKFQDDNALYLFDSQQMHEDSELKSLLSEKYSSIKAVTNNPDGIDIDAIKKSAVEKYIWGGENLGYDGGYNTIMNARCINERFLTSNYLYINKPYDELVNSDSLKEKIMNEAIKIASLHPDFSPEHEDKFKNTKGIVSLENLTKIDITIMLAKIEGELDTLDRLNTLDLKPYEFIENEIYKNLVTFNDMYDQGAVDSYLNYNIALKINDLIMSNSEFSTNFNKNVPDYYLPDADFHIEHAEKIKQSKGVSLKPSNQSDRELNIKALFSDVLQKNETSYQSQSEKRFNQIVDQVKADDILIFTSDAFIVNKLQGKDVASKENMELVTALEKENKCSAVFVLGDKYKQWMEDNKENVIEYFDAAEKTSFTAELSIPVGDEASRYELHEKVIENMHTGKQFVRGLHELSSSDVLTNCTGASPTSARLR